MSRGGAPAASQPAAAAAREKVWLVATHRRLIYQSCRPLRAAFRCWFRFASPRLVSRRCCCCCWRPERVARGRESICSICTRRAAINLSWARFRVRFPFAARPAARGGQSRRKFPLPSLIETDCAARLLSRCRRGAIERAAAAANMRNTRPFSGRRSGEPGRGGQLKWSQI